MLKNRVAEFESVNGLIGIGDYCHVDELTIARKNNMAQFLKSDRCTKYGFHWLLLNCLNMSSRNLVIEQNCKNLDRAFSCTLFVMQIANHSLVSETNLGEDDLKYLCFKGKILY